LPSTTHIVTIFGSSRPREGDEEYQLAYRLGAELARHRMSLCNGGYGGTMEAAARGAKERHGSTIGVTVQAFPRSANRWIDREIREEHLLLRLQRLVELGDAYVVLKGGTGTLLELACVWEFINKGLVAEKPIVVVGGFWERVVETLREETIWEGAGDCGKFIRRVDSPEECVQYLRERLGST
jgi:uncharacterized protein (TIGR00730 family)